jgi:putative nucleotidyltransferase with HDIG domain
MAIYERLELLDSDLQVLAAQSRGHKLVAPGDSLHGHFRGVTLFGADGNSLASWGEAVALPPVTPEERQYLLSGRPLLNTRSCASSFGGCVTMMRVFDSGRPELTVLAGDPNPEYLWATQSLPPGLSFCVLTPAQMLLFCSDGRTDVAGNAFPALQHASGFYQWQNERTLYDAAYWKLLLKPGFFERSWTITVSEKHEDVLAPMQHFRNTFPLIVLLSLWVVLLLSLIQIRRTLGPVEKLRQGTLAIGAQHFDSRVDVHSGDEFESLAESFNAMALQLGRQFHTLRTINEVDQAIFASLNREAIIDAVLAHMPSLLPSDAFAVSTFDPARSSGWIRFRMVQCAETRTQTVQVAASDLLLCQNNQDVFAVATGQNVPRFVSPLRDAGMSSFLILPIRVDGSMLAALVCAHRGTPQIAPEDAHDARQVADQLAVAFSNVQLIEAMEQLHWGTLTALARAIDAKSEWTAGHSERVTNLALEIGRAMGLSAKDLRIMHRGGLLHDVGKIGTPPEVLDKPGKLGPEEMRIMRDHVRIGVRILEPIAAFREALPIVAQHHEWFDGSGYPAGLAGEDISLYARIFAVADCYDALTSDRPYRKGLPKQQTLAMIQAGVGKQFDPRVVDVFLRLCAEKQAQPIEEAMAAQPGQSG